MSSEASLPMQNHDQAGGVPWMGVVAVRAADVDALPDFLTAVRQNSVTRAMQICLVADATDSGRIATELDSLKAVSDWSLIVSDQAVDHMVAITEAAGRFAGRDIILLGLEASLPFAWDARLRKAAYADSHIAVAMAMCDVDPMFALLDPPIETAPEPALVDRTAFVMGNRSFFEVPKIHPFCTYFRRDALDACLPPASDGLLARLPNLDALTRRLRTSGWSCVLCDFLYIGIKSDGTDVAPADDVEELAYRQNHPLGGLRRAVAAAICEGIDHVSAPGLDPRPVQLHIMHFWGGGLDKWVRDFGRADSSCINLVFSSFRIGENGGQRLVLYSDPVDPNPIRVWDIAQPIRSTLSSSIEYRRILEQIIREFEVEAIIVSSLIGHTLDAISQPVKTLVVCHDFYPICQAINPQFGKTCERCTLDDLRLCARANPLNSIFVDQTSEEWHGMRSLYVDRLLTNRIEMVVPSPSVEVTLKRLAPRLREVQFHLVPHGIDMVPDYLPIATRSAGERLRIVVLGRLSRHKGTELLREACEELRSMAEITLVGCGRNGVKLAEACNWAYIEKYQPEELPAIMRKLAPHAGLLPPVIPETFSYTLSELNALGVPTIATSLGSFRDRIVDGESGFLFEPTKRALIELIRRLHADPAQLVNIARRLAESAAGRTVAEMVKDYRALIPLAPRQVARFRVGIGLQTGLTEPYRHLTDAYAQMTSAYVQSSRAYEKTRIVYDNLAGVCRQWAGDYDAINLRKRWWRAPKALRLARDLRQEIDRLQQAAMADTRPVDDPDGEIS